MTLPGLPGGEPLPRRSLLDAIGFWLPTSAADPLPEVTVSSVTVPCADPWTAEFDTFRYRAMLRFGMSRPTSHALITGALDPATPEEIMDDLFMADPAGYRMLSEYIVLPDDRHEAVMSEWREP